MCEHKSKYSQMTEEQKQKSREAGARYRASKKGMEAVARRDSNRSEYWAAWRKTPEGKAAKRAQRAKRRAVELQRTIPDAFGDSMIKVIYRAAQEISQSTGIPHEVDHILPLQGREVSGLHVWWNLQIIPARENRVKSNRVEESLTLGG